MDPTTKQTNQLSYIPPGLYTYLVVPARLALTFPHVFLMDDTQYPFSLPAGHAGTVTGGGAEPTCGVFTTMPITLLLIGLPLPLAQRRAGERRALLAAAGLVALGSVIVTLLSWALWGTTQRYEVGFATFFLVAAFIVWAVVLARTTGRRMARRATAIAGITSTLFGAVAGMAVSFTGYYDTLRISHPEIFRTFEDMTAPLSTLATMVVGKPVLVRVDDGALAVDRPPQGYGTYGERGASAWLGAGGPITVTVIAPHGERTALRESATSGPGATSGAALAIQVQASGHPAVTVPVTSGYTFLPIDLDWGLNRIKLALAGVKPRSPYVLRLRSILLKP